MDAAEVANIAHDNETEAAWDKVRFANAWEAEEDRLCWCGAAGSGELHTDWCDAAKFNGHLTATD